MCSKVLGNVIYYFPYLIIRLAAEALYACLIVQYQNDIPG
jgi:hypothetical protein